MSVSALGLERTGGEIPYGAGLGSCLTHQGEQRPSTLQQGWAAGLHNGEPHSSLGLSLNPAFSLQVAPHARAQCPSIKNTKADR